MARQPLTNLSSQALMMGAWAGAFVLYEIVAVLRGADDPWSALLLAIPPMVVLAGLLVRRTHISDVFLHAATAALTASMLFGVAVAPTDLVAASSASSLIVPVLFTGLWNKPVLSYCYASVGSVAYLLIIAGNDWPLGMVDSWLTTTGLTFGTAVVLQVISSRTDRLVHHDALTGMLNRTGLDAYLATHTAAGRATLPRTLVVADIDGFKAINDTFGHAAGDTTLRDLSAAWRGTLRPDDVCVRLGGDEFLLILPQTSTAAAADVIARLRSASRTQFSAGVADWPDSTPFDVALAAADAEMYGQKQVRRTVT